MSKIDLTSFEWRELVFQGKNKEYGAYVLRKGSDKRHNVSMLIVTIGVFVGFSIPSLIKFLESRKGDDDLKNTAVVLSKLPPAEVKKDQVKKIESVEPPPALKTSVKFTAPVIKPDEEVNESDELRSQEEISNTKGIISIADVKGNDEVNGVDIGDLKGEIVQVEEEVIAEAVEQMPSFPGGDAELMAFLNNNIKYPQIAIDNQVKGTVVVRFAVTKTGAIDHVTIQRSVDSALDREAMRVVRKMPNWIPGMQNGVAVAVWYSVPVRFQLD